MMIDGFSFILLALAAFRLTRLLVYDQITAFIRRPFHREVEETEPDGSVVTYIEIKGKGLRSWIGELLSCYWCTGIWCAAFLIGIWYLWPTVAEIGIIIFAIAGTAGLIETITGKMIDS